MKTLLTLLLIIPSLSWGNTFTEKLDSQKIGNLECNNELITELSTNEKESRVFCTFQNIEYSAIVDIGVLMWFGKEDLTISISELKNCLNYMDEEGYEMYCGRGFRLYNYSKDIYVFYRGSDGLERRTYLKKKHAIKLIEWLEGINFKCSPSSLSCLQ